MNVIDNILNNINNWWYNISGQKDYDNKKKLTRQALQFVQSYYNSPGFKERFKKVPEYAKNYFLNPQYHEYISTYGNTVYGAQPNPFTMITHYDSPTGKSYADNKNNVYIDDKEEYPNSVDFDYGSTAAHEYGHVINNNVDLIKTTYYDFSPNFTQSVNGFKGEYAYIFPHFRNNKKYKEILYNLNDESNRRYYEQNPEILYNLSEGHDATPIESYADLIALREALYRFNIYDSTKANNPFTKEHLNQWKKLNKHLRIFDNFDDDEIIQMMNDIAENSSNKNKEFLYAKQGNKLNIIERFKKIHKFNKGGTIPRYIIEGNYLYRINTDNSKTYVPFITGNTYNRFQSSPEFIKTLENAFARYSHRMENERKKLIKLSGKTKKITVKGRGTYKMPIEIFDRIINASKKAGISSRQGLAIAIKESSGYTDPERANTYYRGSLPNKKYQPVNSQGYAGPATVVSNWQYFTNNPYSGLLRGWEDSKWDVNRMTEDAQYQYKKHQSDYDQWDKNIDEDIFVNIFKLPLNKVNPNEKDYVSNVYKIMRNMSYKFGGTILKRSEGGDIPPIFSEGDTGFIHDPDKELHQKQTSNYKTKQRQQVLDILLSAFNLIDPTGITSWPDVYNSVTQAYNDGEIDAKDVGVITWSILGALPMIGKVTAPAKLAKMSKRLADKSPKLLNKVSKYIEKGNKIVDTLPELNPITKSLTSNVQDLTSKYLTNPIMLNGAFFSQSTSNKGYLKWAYGTNVGVNVINFTNNLSDLTGIFNATKELIDK